ncbi:BglG family transcription antiterminator [Listeria grayi]|uniref:BglG family transcription antiterminator n=1 Tax=Listeria grayi TaxID=1641 RepID=UPI0019019373|nr:PRD domain-containing protein [Listeria grayi]
MLEEKFQIQLPDYEREYIDIHILAIEKSSLNDTDGEMLQVLDDSEKLQQIIRSTLGGYSPDEELINSLLVHLNAAVKRLKLEVSIHNPYTEEIKGNFSGAFAISIELASAIEAGFAIKLNEDEIAFITLHIQSFLDREAQTKREVILVCSSGYGTSKLLEQRIRQTFGAALHVKQVLGIRDLQKANIQDELIISTIPIEKSNSPILVVSPLMTNADIQKINTFLTKHTTSSSDVFFKASKKDICMYFHGGA